MPTSRISDIDKRRIVAAHKRYENYVETSRQLRILQATAYAIIRCYQQHNVVARGGTRYRLVDKEMIDGIVSVVEEHPDYTLIQINTELRCRLPLKPRVSVANVLNGRLITFKLLCDVSAKRNSLDVKAARTDIQ